MYKRQEYDETKTVDAVIEMAVQVNGKVRGKITLSIDGDQDQAHQLALDNENIQKFLEGKHIIKEIFIPGKIYNIVAK